MKVNPSSEMTDYSAAMPETAEDGAKPMERPKKTVYPDITIRGDEAAKLMAQFTAGDTFTAEVEFKVSAHTSRRGTGKEYMTMDEAKQDSIELEIQSIEVEDAPGGGGSDEESAEDAVDSYQASKATPPEED